MKNVLIAAVVLLALAVLSGCATPRVTMEDGSFAAAFEPAVGPSRVQEGEEALTVAILDTQEAVADLALKVEGGEEVIASLEASAVELGHKQDKIANKDLTDSGWFYVIMAALGIPLVKPVGRAGVRAGGALRSLVATLPPPPADPKPPVA
jgi:curli biogenesis system outer membrane secretion channel CsgG